MMDAYICVVVLAFPCYLPPCLIDCKLHKWGTGWLKRENPVGAQQTAFSSAAQSELSLGKRIGIRYFWSFCHSVSTYSVKKASACKMVGFLPSTGYQHAPYAILNG